MRLLAWGCAVGLAACQLVAGIKEGSSHGPCTTNSECPASETCVAAHCQAKGTSGGAGSGAKAGGGGVSGVAGGAGKSMGGSSGHAGSSASAGGSGMSQAGATVAQGGDGGGGGGGGVSGGGGDGGGSDAGDAGAGDTTGAGGRGGAGGAAGGGAGAGGAGAGTGGAGGVAGTTAGSSGSSGMAGTGGAGPIRIMPLGDGITAGTCMRAFLWKELTDNAYPAFDFVGTRTAGDTCAPTEYDKNHEGHSGYRVTDLLSATSLHTDSGGDPYTGSSADLAAWFDGRPADIVLMVFGSNDLLSTSSTAADTQSAYSAILAKLRSVNAHVTLLVGLLPPMSTSKCGTTCATRLSEVNAAIPGWAAAANTTDSRVIVVDLNTGFDVTNTTDGIKPNDVGAQFLADRWYSAIDAL